MVETSIRRLQDEALSALHGRISADVADCVRGLVAGLMVRTP